MALAGDAGLENMKANTLAPSEDLLAWKALNLRGLSVAQRRATVNKCAAASAQVSISPAEYPALILEVYKRADMPKLRNVIGLAKELPQGEMGKLLLANIKVTDEDIRALVVQRGVAVKA